MTPEQLDGLTPVGVRRLRELRSENNELHAKIETLERELASERLSHEVDVEVRHIAPRPATAQPISRAGDGGGPSDPESGTGPPPKGRRAALSPKEARRRKRLKKAVGNVLFYLALALALVVAVFVRAARQGAPTSVAGFSGMLVLTESMQDAIPKGSFVLVKHVEPEELQIGDDITFMVNPTTSVTHRIVDIRPQASGVPIVQTKGVNNPNPDAPVAVENIVGKVVYHSLFLGLLAKGVSDNWPLLVFLLAVWMVLGKVLLHIFREDSSPQRQAGTRDSPHRTETP